MRATSTELCRARNVGAQHVEHACHNAIGVKSCRGRGLAVPAVVRKHNCRARVRLSHRVIATNWCAVMTPRRGVMTHQWVSPLFGAHHDARATHLLAKPMRPACPAHSVRSAQQHQITTRFCSCLLGIRFLNRSPSCTAVGRIANLFTPHSPRNATSMSHKSSTGICLQHRFRAQGRPGVVLGPG